MRAQRVLRTWHRRISIVVGIQLLLWTASGLVFSLRPIEEIRGEHLVREEVHPPEVAEAGFAPVAEVLRAAGGSAPMQLGFRRGRWIWTIGEGARALHLDARNGAPSPPMTEAEARAEAHARLRAPGAIVGAQLLEEPPARGEYRGGPTPAWRVDFVQPEGAHLYLDARSGELHAVRTRAWRRFDFFWGLHILDWWQREDFSHWLLRIAAGLGVATSASGLVLAVLVTRSRWRSRRLVAEP